LQKAFDAGALRFFGDLVHLAEPASFHALAAHMRRAAWVVYAKKPFGGPAQVLAYLGRYTHRVAIANSRIQDCDGDHVAFAWKDYRDGGAVKTMCLKPDEFIRRNQHNVIACWGVPKRMEPSKRIPIGKLYANILLDCSKLERSKSSVKARLVSSNRHWLQPRGLTCPFGFGAPPHHIFLKSRMKSGFVRSPTPTAPFVCLQILIRVESGAVQRFVSKHMMAGGNISMPKMKCRAFDDAKTGSHQRIHLRSPGYGMAVPVTTRRHHVRQAERFPVSTKGVGHDVIATPGNARIVQPDLVENRPPRCPSEAGVPVAAEIAEQHRVRVLHVDCPETLPHLATPGIRRTSTRKPNYAICQLYDC
jgi:hypothetical protein